MPDYAKLYAQMVHASEAVIEMLEESMKHNIDRSQDAVRMLIAAEQRCEDMYIDMSEAEDAARDNIKVLNFPDGTPDEPEPEE